MSLQPQVASVNRHSNSLQNRHLLNLLPNGSSPLFGTKSRQMRPVIGVLAVCAIVLLFVAVIDYRAQPIESTERGLEPRVDKIAACALR